MMRVDGAWKPAEAVRDPRGPIWPGATSIQGFLPELGRFSGRGGARASEGVGWTGLSIRVIKLTQPESPAATGLVSGLGLGHWLSLRIFNMMSYASAQRHNDFL